MKSVKSYSVCIKQKKITKKVYNNIMNSVKVQYKMDTIFLNSKNSKTSKSFKILLNLADKIDFKRSDTYVALPNLSIYYTRKTIKNVIITININYQLIKQKT